MIINTKFGIGEIVIYGVLRDGELICDVTLEVIEIYYDGISARYLCRYPATGVTAVFKESQLLGDPEYNQEKACYDTKFTGSRAYILEILNDGSCEHDER